MVIDKQMIQQRLQELQAEIAKGEQQLNSLEQQRVTIEQTMLRLSGAVQVLNELLETTSEAEPPATLSAAG